MKPGNHNFFKQPLDAILGSTANIQTLRAMMRAPNAPMGIAEIAARSGLSNPGARKAIHNLSRSRIVTTSGSRRSSQFSLNTSHPLWPTLQAMFRNEQSAFEDFIATMRKALTGIVEIKQAWVARLPTDPQQPIEISIVTDAKSLAWMVEEVRTHLLRIEKHYDLVIEFTLYTPADEVVMPPQAIELVTDPTAAKVGKKMPRGRSHQDKDERTLTIHRVLAAMIQRDHSLIDRASQHINRVVQAGTNLANSDLIEWRQIFETYSPQRLGDFITSETSRAVRLRQSSPFFAILTNDERDHVFEALTHK